MSEDGVASDKTPERMGVRMVDGHVFVPKTQGRVGTLTDLPTFYEIKAEDLPPFGKKAEDCYARKI